MTSNPSPQPRRKKLILTALGVWLLVIVAALFSMMRRTTGPKPEPEDSPRILFATPAPKNSGPGDTGSSLQSTPRPLTVSPAPPPDVKRGGEELPDPNSTAGVEYLFDHFDKGHLAFNAPTTIPLHRPQLIHLVISPTGTPEELAALIAAPGTVETAEVRVSGVMQAELVGGSAFRIEALSPTEQLVARAEPTEWRWQVTPLQGGPQSLHLTVNAIVRTGDKVERRRTLRAFDREIAVEVPWTTAALGVAGRSWIWLVLAGLIFGAVLGGRRWVLHRSQASAPPASSTSDAVIFVSYARRDLDRINPYVTALHKQGFSVWIDVHGIEGASLWTAEIAGAIRQCRVLLLMATPAAMESQFVTRELLLAQEEGRPIVPVWFAGGELPSALRLVLAGVQRVEATRDIGATVDRIVRALAKLGIQATEPGTQN